MPGSTASLGIRIELEDSASSGLRILSGSFQGIQGLLQTFGSDWEKLNNTTRAFAGIAAGSGIAFDLFSKGLMGMIDASANLEQAMLKVSLNVEGADESLGQMREHLIELDNNATYTSKQIADGFAALGQHVLDAEQILNGAGEAMVNLGLSIQDDVVPAANLLGSAMEMFRMDASQAGEAADLLSFALHHGIKSTEEMQQALEQAGAQAAAAKWSFQDFVFALDLLGRAGFSGSQAGTALRFMIGALLTPTQAAARAMGDLGVIVVNQTNPALLDLVAKLEAVSGVDQTIPTTVRGFQTLFNELLKFNVIETDKTFYQYGLSIGALSNKLFDGTGSFKDFLGVLEQLSPKLKDLSGPELQATLNALGTVKGGKAFQTFFGDLDKTKKDLGELQGLYDKFLKQGGAEGAADKTRNTFSAQIEALMSSLNSLAGNAGQKVTKNLTDATNSMNDFLGVLRKSKTDVDAAVATFLILGTALASLGLVLGLIAVSAAIIGAPFLVVVGVVAGVVAGITALAAGGAMLAANWKSVSAFFQPVVTIFQQFGKVAAEIGGKAFADIGKSAGIIGKQLDGVFKGFGATLKALMPTFVVIGAVIGGIFTGLIAMIGPLVFGIIAFIGGFVQFFIGLWQAVMGVYLVVQGVVQAIIGLFTGDFSGAIASFQAAWETFASAIGNIWAGLWTMVISVLVAVLGGIGQFFIGLWNGIVQIFQSLYKTLVGNSIIPDMVTGIVKWFQSLPQMVLSIITGFINWIVTQFTLFKLRTELTIKMWYFAAVLLFETWKQKIIDTVVKWASDVFIKFNKFKDDAIKWFSELGTKLLKAGEDLMKMLGKGIEDGIKWVKEGIDKITKWINDHMPHSPAKMGPLSNADKYMPGMMRMFASGIQDNIPLLQKSALSALSTLQSQFSTPITTKLDFTSPSVQAARNSSLAISSSGPNNAITNINLVLDGQVISSYVMDRVRGTLVMNGATRKLR